MFSKIMSLKLQKSILYIVLWLPYWQYIRQSSQLWKSTHYEISSRKLKIKAALNSGLNTICCFLESHGIFTSTSINKVDTLSTSANIDEITQTRCFCISFGWLIDIVLFFVCTEYLKLFFFTVVMQLIRLFLVVNNNLIIDKLLQMTKKRPCFRLHCWHTSESCDSCGTAAQTHANDQTVFFLFDPSTHTTYRSPGSLTVGTGW